MTRFCFILLALCGGLSCGATTLTVDKTSGDDAAAAADLTRATAFATIQAAVDAAASGDVVRVRPGVYDVGGAVVDGEMNRVHITKTLTLEAVASDPSETVIQGSWDTSSSDGYGPAAVRCVYVGTNDATVVVRGFTLSDGAASTATGVGGLAGISGGSAYLVDSVVKGCFGRSLESCTAVRCRVYGNVGSDAVYGSTLVNSLVCGSQKASSIETEPVAARNSSLYNSTIVDNAGYAFRGSSKLYNSIALQASKSMTSASSDSSVFITNSVAAPWVNNKVYPGTDSITNEIAPFFSPASGDFRIESGSPVLTLGDAALLSWVTLPAGISAFVDLAGNAIPQTGVIAAGAYQLPVDPATASGEILCKGLSSAEGYIKGYSHDFILRTEEGPRPVRLDVQLAAGKELVGHSLPGVVGGNLYPQMNGEVWTMTPPNGTVITNTPVFSTDVYYVDPDPERGSDENPGTQAAPLLSIQAAVAKVAKDDAVVIHCAAGVYTNNSANSSRVYITRSNVRLVGAGRDRSFILGQRAPGTDGPDGRGTGALRCVYAASVAGCVQGFTLADGYTLAGDESTTSRRGGLVYSGNGTFQILDCTLKNGWAARGMLGFHGVYRRCVIEGFGEGDVGTHFRAAEAFISSILAKTARRSRRFSRMRRMRGRS